MSEMSTVTVLSVISEYGVLLLVIWLHFKNSLTSQSVKQITEDVMPSCWQYTAAL
jgi:hypothetical protein